MSNYDKELIKKYVPFSKWEDANKLLESGYPVQYIIGHVDFYDCLINVDQNVLIPRFETEYLVDDLLKLMKRNNFVSPNIIDIGTGSGCISIALKKNYNCKITAIDNSKEALSLARQNAIQNNVNINFLYNDIETFTTNEKFDILVSNPPYVPYEDEVDPKTKYEPQNAIFATENGLYFYKLILQKSKHILNSYNIIAFEVGDGQFASIKQLAKDIYPNANIILKKDLANKERYIYIIND